MNDPIDIHEINHLLTCLAEECGEVAKECCKSLRFGLDDQLTKDPHGPRGTAGPTNRAKIASEMIDLLGVYQMLVKADLLVDLGFVNLPYWVQREMIAKADKVDSYMDYARGIGSLPPGSVPPSPGSH